MDLGLTGKVALVAAASKGLGRGIALELASEGAKVAICSRSEAAIAAAAEDIAAKTGGDVLPIAADLSTREGCEVFVQTAFAKYGAIDILVANAGGPPPGRFEDLDDDAWEKAYALTLMSAVRLTRLVLPHMRAQKSGSILYSTSTTLRQPTAYLTLILSTVFRAGVHGISKTLSAELGRAGIRVNAISPGRIATDRLIQLDTDLAKRQGTTPEAIRARYEENDIPLGRYGRTEEYAAAAVFLVSARASYITGVSLQVDGGMLSSMF